MKGKLKQIIIEDTVGDDLAIKYEDLNYGKSI